MKKYVLLTGIVMLVFIAAGCGKKKTDTGHVTERIVIPATATEVARGKIVKVLTYTGSVDAAKRVEIAPLTPGRITSITVDEGSLVKKGQVLVKMDDMSVAPVKTAFEMAEKNLERTRALHERGSMTDVQLEVATSGYDQTKAAYDQVMENIVITAPFSGIIIGKYYSNGEVYSSMKPGPLGLGAVLSLAQFDKMKVEVKVPEQDYVQISTGAPVKITIDAFEGKTFEGKVARISPALDMMSRTATVTVEIENKEKLIRPGMFTRVQIVTEEKEDILKVPAKAVVVRNDSSFVFKVKKGEIPFIAQPEQIAVVQGMTNADFVEILDGDIGEGDLILSENNVSLTKETTVKVVKFADSEGK